MALPTFTAGNTLPASDLADIVNHLQGASAKTDAWHFRVSSGNNYLITLSDAAGAQKFSIRDSAGVEQFSVNSDGTVSASAIAPTVLTVPSAAAPSQTAEGSIVADSDDDMLTLGTGSATKYIGLSRGAGSDASATKELMYDTTNNLFKVWDGSANRTLSPIFKYKTANQQFSTNTTFADITATSGNLAFDVVANGVYRARYSLPLTMGGTGGAKFQFTGPAAPTLVRYEIRASAGWAAQTADAGANAQVSTLASIEVDSGTAFSSSGGLDSVAAAPTSGTSGTNLIYSTASTITIDLLVVNGANAGTVTLQGAQNSSNSTTDFVAGCWMEAQRVA